MEKRQPPDRASHETAQSEAINVLRLMYEEAHVDFPFDLVEQCLRIEQEYQYADEREVPMERIRKLVSLFVDWELKTEENI